MSTTTQDTAGLSTDHSQATADGAHSHGVVPQGSRAERLTSFDVADFPVPTGREEEWRFAPVDRIAPLFGADTDGVLPGHGVLTTVVEAPEVTVEIVDRDDARLGAAGRPGDRAAVAAWASFPRATVVTIPKQAVASSATSIRVEGVEGQHPLEPTGAHLLVHAQELSEAVVVLDHVGHAMLTETVEVVVEDGAHLTLVSVQDWAEGSVHTASHRLRLGRDATVKHIVVTLGGDVVRITPDAEFVGENGSVEMLGVYFADAGQHQEHRLFVDHAVPSCRSRVTYKGALQGQGAHTVWVGDVLIRAEAEGTDTYELNRNLVLTDGARADSVPNLEIETGLIEGAGHASATGRFDDEQLFYLRARGIPELDARRLVVRGFFAELIQQIGVAEVEERLITSIENELNASMSALDTVAAEPRVEGVEAGAQTEGA
ncbi:Fe-S cluster assembly protein SufD [Cellulomonas chengniuliangii]|uniref:Fe-S cluster assembly protein SufD n=1 Tax=Cellulomonas chengniuliangii TaxID=2968084 RepID=A0ABY5KU46_9CELL|nr:Fe-S cluster assembly protein SufD [Cellulomonas chengniuliangii]MCC2308702.1 Fe-S cluster assembly protein SufD [Cellulomonas chengniuliangii]MCC2317720.1 Fe-S cluster assembly protein SufD [Cellulomonas chengniuliangii]UUI74057.1 Fe-S cluster assembly protein SufD [Cellulomonas chengniuliangii]